MFMTPDQDQHNFNAKYSKHENIQQAHLELETDSSKLLDWTSCLEF